MRIVNWGILFLTLGSLAVSCDSKPAPTSADAPLPLTEAEAAYFQEQGKLLAQTAFEVLSSRLQAAMEQGGPAGAIAYCQAVANPLLDSLAQARQATIRRTSLKIRNPLDVPDSLEQQALQQYADRVARQEALVPEMKLVDGQTVAFYAPIKVQPQCLACHGESGKTLNPIAEDALRSAYPQDQALGYRDGDWRGLWSIRFIRDPKQFVQ